MYNQNSQANVSKNKTKIYLRLQSKCINWTIIFCMLFCSKRQWLTAAFHWPKKKCSYILSKEHLEIFQTHLFFCEKKSDSSNSFLFTIKMSLELGLRQLPCTLIQEWLKRSRSFKTNQSDKFSRVIKTRNKAFQESNIKTNKVSCKKKAQVYKP